MTFSDTADHPRRSEDRRPQTPLAPAQRWSGVPELVDGALDAIRRLGRDVSMDEIAAEIGVSKTVLYRYFVDKNDLTTAVMMRFTQTTLIPNLAAALASGTGRVRADPRDHSGLRRHRRRRTRSPTAS